MSVENNPLCDELFERRLQARIDEISRLYLELYNGDECSLASLIDETKKYYGQRKAYLKKLDIEREKDTNWYQRNDLVGSMFYTENFGMNLKGVREHLDYLKECNINYIHLMPLLDTTEGKSDGGYAVKNYRKVAPNLGTMKDLEDLTKACHENKMCVCLDYVMNHTSEDHEWAIKARAGEKTYQDMYYFYDDYTVPAQFEQTVPQVFPKTAPGNFTYLPEINKFVMTTFYPYQWDLNYWNPTVFNEMAYNLLFIANKGIDIIRIDAVPYIWKELGTSCRNLPKVHNIVRLMRLLLEIAAPGTLLLGEVVMEPKELAPYFGSAQKPECHMLYNATTMCTLWHTVATKDVRLLRYQTDQVARLPKNYTFINYIRCHDDIGWGLDYNFLREFGMEEVPHKAFLNDFFLGNGYDSVSTGELYNADPVTGDARFCATTASMCGIEKGLHEGNSSMVATGIQLDLMLHSFILFQSGIPVLYSGDEIGAFNDWSYKENVHKVEDSRYIHRGAFPWDRAARINVRGSIEKRLHDGLNELAIIRGKNAIFNSDADVYTIETHNDSVLGMIRIKDGNRMIGLFNFSKGEESVEIYEFSDQYINAFSGKKLKRERNVILKPYEYLWAYM